MWRKLLGVLASCALLLVLASPFALAGVGGSLYSYYNTGHNYDSVIYGGRR